MTKKPVQKQIQNSTKTREHQDATDRHSEEEKNNNLCKTIIIV